MDPLRIRVGDQDVVFTEPGKARAAARNWTKMARELGPEAENEPADVTEKRRDLRARAKAANDWARKAEDAAPTEPKVEPKREKPAGREEPSPARRQAARALAATGVRRTAKAGKATRVRTRRAVRRYEAAGGAELTSLGEFATFFFGSLVLLVLLEDALTKKGSSSLSKASQVGTNIVHRVIAPVPIVNAPGG